MKKYVCEVCGYEYDPAVGDPDNGIAPGTAFEDLPDDWTCPTCGVGKDQFAPEDHCRKVLFRSIMLTSGYERRTVLWRENHGRNCSVFRRFF